MGLTHMRRCTGDSSAQTAAPVHGTMAAATRSAHTKTVTETNHLPVRLEPGRIERKELLARHIHRGSDRSGLFVSVNCGAIRPT